MKHDTDPTEYLASLKSARLSETARNRIQADLLSYARFHPADENVRMSDPVRSMKQVLLSTWYTTRLSGFKFTIRTMTAALVLVALLVGGGTTYAAQGAVPGDVLYPVKIEVNDNVRSALAISDESKASVQADLVKERLQEAEQLAADGKLNASTSATLSANVQWHYQSAIQHSNASESRGDLDTATNVRASLSGALHSYSRVLDHLDRNVKGNNSTQLIGLLNVYANDVAHAQAKASTSVATGEDPQSKVSAALSHTSNEESNVNSMLSHRQSELSSDTYAQINGQLTIADDYQMKAKDFASQEDYASAYTSAQSAQVRINLAQNMLNSALRLRTHHAVLVDSIFKNDDEVNVMQASNTAPEATSSATTSFMFTHRVTGESHPVTSDDSKNGSDATDSVELHTQTNSTLHIGTSQDEVKASSDTQTEEKDEGSSDDSFGSQLRNDVEGGLQFKF